MNLRVNLTKRISTPDGFRYCPVVISANGRVRPGAVIVNGKEEKHPEGSYYIDWYEGDKRKRQSVGKDPANAYAQKLNRETKLRAASQGIALETESPEVTGRSIAASVAAFLEETKLTKKPKTYAAYSKTLGYFQESCAKMHLEEIDRKDMLNFAAFLREKGLAPRSCWNKFNVTMLFLKAHGIRGIVGKNDWPKFVEEEPEVYEKEELETLFAACTPEERLLFQFYQQTGMREQEIIYTTWPDVNLTRHTVTVRWKPEYGWTPKNFKEREVPIPKQLSDDLKAAKAKSEKKCPLVFHTSGCLPKFDALHILKAVARRAELDEETFYLHKFRATFATWSLWAGVDLRTVQQWLGHSDMESTLRYLKPSRSEATRDKVNAIFA
jgi:integrase/recombinase XerD